MVVKLVTTYHKIDDNLRQKQLATAMVVCVYGIIVVSISFALFSLMLILFQLSKQIYLKVTAKKGKVEPTARNIAAADNRDSLGKKEAQDNSVAEQNLKAKGVAANNESLEGQILGLEYNMRKLKSPPLPNDPEGTKMQLADMEPKVEKIKKKIFKGHFGEIIN